MNAIRSYRVRDFASRFGVAIPLAKTVPAAVDPELSERAEEPTAARPYRCSGQCGRRVAAEHGWCSICTTERARRGRP